MLPFKTITNAIFHLLYVNSHRLFEKMIPHTKTGLRKSVTCRNSHSLPLNSTITHSFIVYLIVEKVRMVYYSCSLPQIKMRKIALFYIIRRSFDCLMLQ